MLKSVLCGRLNLQVHSILRKPSGNPSQISPNKSYTVSIRNRFENLTGSHVLAKDVQKTSKFPLRKDKPKLEIHKKVRESDDYSNGLSRMLILGAASVGFVLFLVSLDDQKALALGPEGPLMEEFWDNVRRYGLYMLTVSTGAIYTILQPILELLKNPLTAILLLIILAGTFLLLSQVLNAMFGITEYVYDYAY